jgi:hypothetical protein
VYDAVVEGTVFNLRTGAPLVGAEVRVFLPGVCIPEDPECPLPLGVPVRTFSDYNGFYSVEVRTFAEPLRFEAICQTADGPAGAGVFARYTLREGVNRRDLYVDVGWSRAFRQCLSATQGEGSRSDRPLRSERDGS